MNPTVSPIFLAICIGVGQLFSIQINHKSRTVSCLYQQQSISMQLVIILHWYAIHDPYGRQPAQCYHPQSLAWHCSSIGSKSCIIIKVKPPLQHIAHEDYTPPKCGNSSRCICTTQRVLLGGAVKFLIAQYNSTYRIICQACCRWASTETRQ